MTVKASAEWWERLREPFPPEVIGKLPKLNCSACAQKKGGAPRDRHCDRHVVKKCGVCGNFLSEAHIHLDYVGHAATTDRLLKVDPGWTWRPMATEIDTGFPKFDSAGGLWILMTVKGVTRPGYGDGANPKEVISDAIRNAAMRFGVALDLWAKEDLQAVEESPPVTKVDRPAVTAPAVPTAASPAAPAGGDAEHKRAHETKSTLDVVEPDRRLISAAQRTRLIAIAAKGSVPEASQWAIIDAIAGQSAWDMTLPEPRPSRKLIPRRFYDQIVNEIKLVAAGTQV